MEAAINTAPIPQPEVERKDNFFRRIVSGVLDRLHLKAMADKKYAMGGKNPADEVKPLSPQEAVNVSSPEATQTDNSTTTNQKGLGY